jgi:diguanylate cyclase (GGDEF)-like protein
VALLLAWAVVGRVRVALAASVTQAQALVDGRFLTMPEPKAPELRQLTQAMNHMVDRLKGIFHSQAEQVDEYRRLSNCDPLTGISHRRHFMAQLDDAFQREDGPEQSSLVLLRIAELGELNQRLGHERVDSLVVTVTQALQQYAKRVPACLMGRLNGSDFALFIPVPAMAQECGMALSAALRMVLPQFDAQASAYVGAVPVGRHHTLSQVMSLADTALSRAEAAGPFGVELLGSSSQEAHTPMGEAERRMKLEYALSAHKLQLAEFPVLHGDGSLLHLECPMRLQLQEGGPFLPAAHWMPWALRAQLMERVDERSLELALASIAADGRSRCVHMSRAVLSEGGLMSRMHKRLTEAKELSAKLWVEVPEALAIERPEILRVLARQLRPLKVKVGIEHSGGQVARIERMFEVGLDFIKLDGATTRGLATDEHKQQFVHGTVTLLRTMCSEVIAEGVLDEADARALWRCGVSGITGPWASTQAPQWMRSL